MAEGRKEHRSVQRCNLVAVGQVAVEGEAAGEEAVRDTADLAAAGEAAGSTSPPSRLS